MVFSSPSLGRTAFGWSFLAVLVGSQIGLAQPPQAPSTIKKPSAYQFGGFVAPPDPAPISLEQLRALKGGPTLVSFSGQDVPGEDAVKALLDAGQISSLNFQRQFKKVSVDWKQTPFWSAAADLERQTGLIWDSDFSSKLSFHQHVSSHYSGIDGKTALQNPYVLMIATSATRTTTERVSFAKNTVAPDENDRLNNNRVLLSFNLYFDPKLQVESSTLRAVTFQKAGENAPIPDENNRFRTSSANGSNLISTQNFSLPETAPGTTFSRISGTLHAVIATTVEPFQVADLVAANKLTKVIGQNQFTVDAATVTGNSMSVHLSATAAAAVPNQNRANLPSTLFSALRVRDAQGNEIQAGGASSSSGGDKAEGTFSFILKNRKGEAAPGPYSLEWPITTETRSFDVPFELRDITVP